MQVYQYFSGWVLSRGSSDMARPAGLCVGLCNDAGMFDSVKRRASTLKELDLAGVRS
jgi:hypothetical protein